MQCSLKSTNCVGVPKPPTVPIDGTHWIRQFCIAATTNPRCIANILLKDIVSSSILCFLSAFRLVSRIIPLDFHLGPKRGLSASLESLGLWALFFFFHVASGWAVIVGAIVLGPFCVLSSFVGTDGVSNFVLVVIAVN